MIQDFSLNLQYGKIQYHGGSIFNTAKYELDAIAIFIPRGMTSIRFDASSFVERHGRLVKKIGEFELYEVVNENLTIHGLKYVLLVTNPNQRRHEPRDLESFVHFTLREFRELGAQNIGMNGIRIDAYAPEKVLVTRVVGWLRKANHSFNSIHFIDLRNGFNKNARQDISNIISEVW